MKKLSKILPVFLIFCFLAVPLIAGAQTQTASSVQQVICQVVNKIKLILLAVGFGIAFIILIAGGIGYMTSGGNEEKATKSRKLMVNAGIGVLIVIAAVFLLAVVEAMLAGTGVNPFTNPCAGMWQGS